MIEIIAIDFIVHLLLVNCLSILLWATAGIIIVFWYGSSSTGITVTSNFSVLLLLAVDAIVFVVATLFLELVYSFVLELLVFFYTY